MPIFTYSTAVGMITVEEQNEKICGVWFNKPEDKEQDYRETPLLKEAGSQLKEYANGGIKTFTLPLNPIGTPFMVSVWDELCKIPYGHTETYIGVAQKIGHHRAARAVGLACNRNKIPIFIPCHRVIGSNGKLTGFAGGLSLKQRLLSLEGCSNEH
jgi:methylated-DNA-[protein]-cysteine S-methyltransferase